jgi:hypothetical protein
VILYRIWYSVAYGDPIWKALFYRSASGKEPVREWIGEYPKQEKKVIGDAIRDVQLERQWSAPLVKFLGEGLL